MQPNPHLSFLALFIFLSAICTAQQYSVYFDTDKSILTTPNRSFLDSLIEVDAFSKADSFFVSCHCDNRADSTYNYALSMRRANSVKSYLMQKGMKAKIDLYGYGESSPDYPNTANSRYKNRRCDVVLTQNQKKNSSELNVDEWSEGLTLRLEGLEFVGNQALPNYYSMPVLYRLQNIMLAYPELEIELNGHVCCGDDMPLSVSRAKAVYDFLIANGINKNRMAYQGFSNTEPLVQEVDRATQQRNRRVEMKIKKAPTRFIDTVLNEKGIFKVELREIPFKPNSYIMAYNGEYNIELIANMIANSNGYRYTMYVHAVTPSLKNKRFKLLQGYFKRVVNDDEKMIIKPGRESTYRNQDILILEVNPI